MRSSTVLWAVNKAAAPVKKVAPAAPRRTVLPKPIARSLQASAKANTGPASHTPQATNDWPVIGRPPNAKAAASGEYVVDERQKGLFASYMALSPNSRYLLGGVLAVFATITYYMDQLVPEEKEEPIETIIDRRAKEGALGQIPQRPS